MTLRKACFAFASCLLLCALPSVAADPVIYSGIDLWQTTADGSTRMDFGDEPIPADFFCSGSAPFREIIGFRGVPLATFPEGQIGATDTIVQRLDDAHFNARGVAFTRVQVRALSFEGLETVKTVCGEFRVTTELEGEQPITKMKITRQGALGGAFYSPISVNIKMVFSRVDGAKHEPLEVFRELRFAPLPDGRWAEAPGDSGLVTKSVLLVDTDNDGNPDTYLPGTSNFAAGWNQEPGQKALVVQNPGNCHCDWNTCAHQHCIVVPGCVTDPTQRVCP